MHDPNESSDRWADYRTRREEWRQRRRERREAWREQRRARRDEMRGRWGDMMMGYGPWSYWSNRAGGSASAAADLQKKVDEMQATIKALNERVQTLEKLATDPEARLRDEIDRLRSQPSFPA